METFAKRLRQYVRVLGLSDSEAARRAGLSERRFHNYLAATREPDLATLVRICQSLGTTPDVLLGFDQDDTNPSTSAVVVSISQALKSAPRATLELAADLLGTLLRHSRITASDR